MSQSSSRSSILSTRSNGYESLLWNSSDRASGTENAQRSSEGRKRKIGGWILFSFFIFMAFSMVGLLVFRVTQEKWSEGEYHPPLEGAASIFTSVAMKTLANVYGRDREHKIKVTKQTTEECLNQIFSGKIDFAVVEDFPNEPKLKNNEIQIFPLFGLALEVISNVPNNSNYLLTMDLLARIYGGHPWNIADEELRALNPNTSMVTGKIDPIHFTISSAYGIDRIFPNILCSHYPEEWMSCNNASAVNWQTTPDGVVVNSDGVVMTLVSNIPNSFGYIAFGQEIPLPATSVGFLLKDGKTVVKPTVTTVQNSVQKGKINPTGTTKNFKPPEDCLDCWPVSALSYLVFRKSSIRPSSPFLVDGNVSAPPSPRNCSVARGFSSLLKWIYEEDLKEFKMEENLVEMDPQTSRSVLNEISLLEECPPFIVIAPWVPYVFAIGFGLICLVLVLLIVFAIFQFKKREGERIQLITDQENMRRFRIESVMVKNDEELIINDEIGRGTFSTVYSGIWRETKVAVKKISIPDLKRRGLGDSTISLEREIELMSTLRHPNIVLFLFACEKPDYFYIVSELCGRGSLHGLIHDEEVDLDLKMQMRLSLDAARGMLHLHSMIPMIIHRDLKPSNLLVDKDWNLKVSDFGISISMAGQRMMTGNCGTVEYMAPECLTNQPYTEKCDVFSFGVVLAELFSRSPLYPDLSVVQIRYQVRTQSMRPQLNSFVPPPLKDLIEECWQTNPAVRPPFSQIVARLTELSLSLESLKTSKSSRSHANAKSQKKASAPFTFRTINDDFSINGYRGSV